MKQQFTTLASCPRHDASQCASIHLSTASCSRNPRSLWPRAIHVTIHTSKAETLPRRSCKQPSIQLASCTSHDAFHYASQLAIKGPRFHSSGPDASPSAFTVNITSSPQCPRRGLSPQTDILYNQPPHRQTPHIPPGIPPGTAS